MVSDKDTGFRGLGVCRHGGREGLFGVYPDSDDMHGT